MVAVAITGVLGVLAFTFFSSSLSSYVKLSKDSEQLTELAQQSQRIAKVLRGLNDIVSAGDNDLTAYAYFSPADQYVSQIRYYKNPAGTSLMADVTRMTADPPAGATIPSSLRTYTVISSFHTVSGVSLFTYLDAGDIVLTTPIADQHMIKAIKINLSVPNVTGSSGQYTSTSLEVALRNRKTNL
jgi:hypothetical protein